MPARNKHICYSYSLYIKAFLFCICLTGFLKKNVAQAPITAITYAGSGVPSNTENNIKGAGYTFSQWISLANFTVNYATSPADDVVSITSFNAAGNNYIPITFPNAFTKVRRVANADIKDNRNFITYWNRCSSFPPVGDIIGIFNCLAPKVVSMEASLLSNNINSGYDNVFSNSISAPHYNNIERVDFIVPNGFVATGTPNKAGFTVFDRGVGDTFKIAAITAVDAARNPTAYKTLVTVPASMFTAAGLLPSSFDYIIFVSDPMVASGELRPSTKSNQNIRGAYISLQDLGIGVYETVYGYSLFAQDVNPALGHVLTDPSTFPVDTNSGNCLDLLNVNSLFQSGIVILPIKLGSFTGFFNKRNKTVDLNWTTSLEQGLKNFTIEKSENGTDWKSAGYVNGSGNISGAEYSFADNNLSASAKSFYRLKMINDDGSFQYSNIVVIQLPSNKEINLITGESSLIVKTELKIKTARLIDMSGKDVQPEKNKLSGIDIEFSLNTLPSGIYILVLVDENNKPYSKKFMKL